MEEMLEPEASWQTRERILIKWWRGWYALGWRGWLAHKLLEKELRNF